MIGRRFKLLLPLMTPELDWEIEILEMLEQDVYPYLQAQGVPTEEWEYYVAFAKRMWERRVTFDLATFTLEKTSLVNEFTWRGLNPVHLAVIQTYAEDKAKKKLRAAPPLPEAEYAGATVLGDEDDMAQWPGATTTEGIPIGPAEWGGVTVFCDNNEMIRWAGVTVVKGTVT